MNTIVKVTLLYLACFVSASLLLIHEFIARSLSPRFAFPIFIVTAYIFAYLLIKKTARSPRIQAVGPIDTSTRKLRIFAIRAGKVWILLLVLALLTGLSRAKNFPLWATLVAVAINLIITATIISTVVRLQNSLK